MVLEKTLESQLDNEDNLHGGTRKGTASDLSTAPGKAQETDKKCCENRVRGGPEGSSTDS